MLNYSKIRKGNVIHNTNGNSYDVLSVRKRNPYGQQDLLLKDKRTKQIVVARGWDCNSHKNERIGSWGQGIYLGALNNHELKKVTKSFKERKF